MFLGIQSDIYLQEYINIYILIQFFFGDAAHYFKKAICLSRDFPMFLLSLGSTLCVSSSMCTCRFIHPLLVLAPYDSNVAVYTKC